MSATAFQRMRREKAAREAADKAKQQEQKSRQNEPKPLSKMTKAELIELASVSGIDVDEKMTKAQIIEEIESL